MAHKKTRTHKPKKPRSIRMRLMTAIIFIMLLTVLIPVIAYNSLPDGFICLCPGHGSG